MHTMENKIKLDGHHGLKGSKLVLEQPKQWLNQMQNLY
ncbi:hypothetical protein EV11_0767 [Prochlorococcus sp. SS52]|nr:hypothetical protein EV04_0931 [Prochlorococcus marinus str. LG]KGG22348.1 hypothetical protein EV08_0166 [Prochlorococcus marinus str. SS2]KGG22683.1 hypothetical protein EV09_1422 [Prochlorococcus marinus str. SS35]KGG32895.1 hypothetical protein EV10_0875 [Prochlorococcus marinus str. SS51]KGG36590.1 hypothetical protein EV11_0767 [Prochlorococcus sp. SS52]